MLWSGQGVSGLVWHVWARWCCFIQVFPSPWLGYDACVNVLKPAVSGLWGEGLAQLWALAMRSQGRGKRTKPCRCWGEAAHSLATSSFSYGVHPLPSLHAPILASPSQRAGWLLSKCQPKPLLKAEHRAVGVDLLLPLSAGSL